MTCPGCTLAETDPTTPIKYAGCIGCDARALATTQAAKDAMQGHPQQLQAAMRKVWPSASQYREGRLAVHRWINKGTT
jgi:hypothetical protein